MNLLEVPCGGMYAVARQANTVNKIFSRTNISSAFVRLFVGIAIMLQTNAPPEAASMKPDLPVDIILHPRRSVIDLQFAALDREVASVFRAVQKAAEKQQATPPASA